MQAIEDQLEFLSEDESANETLVEYDITTYPSDFTLVGLAQMWRDKDITIPLYQREFVWSIKQSSLLIESFLIGLPVPPVFFYIDDQNKNLVIDGQQRLLSIFFYLEGYFGNDILGGKRQVFRLTGLNEKNPFYNKRFMDLEPKDKRKLETSVLRAVNIRQLSPKDQSTSVYHIFERLNTGGTPLKAQEIRNCVFRSEFLNQLKDLNTNTDWRKILGKTHIDKHQNDVELILRAFSFCYYLNEYEKPMKEFLNKIAKRNQNALLSSFEIFKINFIKGSKIINEKLRERPFSVRGPLNSSLFDSIFCTVINNLDLLTNDFSNRYEQLLLDQKFIDYTTLATSDPKIVKERFAYVKDKLIKN